MHDEYYDEHPGVLPGKVAQFMRPNHDMEYEAAKAGIEGHKELFEKEYGHGVYE